ncbi:hypothetical protein FIBSPDRAFT_506828 [Athelia psychrophila]|uniref:Uncharacterized protein n=1 Tax=Athelia psychrophila TaxID=1759441 RepID=A0A166K0Z6_9AGAM|nr:hypothetical protein FIBSPDRAFT_506828 [Fibularhizoctonia sp. CBS 109695]
MRPQAPLLTSAPLSCSHWAFWSNLGTCLYFNPRPAACASASATPLNPPAAARPFSDRRPPLACQEIFHYYCD